MRPRLAVVGPGRVGWALARGAAGVGYRVTGVAGGTQEARQRLAASVAARVLPEPAAVEADIVLLTVPDIYLPALAQTVRAASATFVVHAAGALSAAALGVPGAGTFHPLRSFAGPPRDVELRGYGVAVEAADGMLAEQLDELAAALGMLPLAIPADARARYHAAAVLAGNASIALLEVARRQLTECGVEPKNAERVLARLLSFVAENALRLGLEPALSGPIRRGDAATVARNIAALEATDGSAGDLYRILGSITLEIAERLPDGPDRSAARRVAEALSARRAPGG